MLSVMTNARPTISVIVTLYNEAPALPLLCEQIWIALEKLNRPYEVLLIDDGSTDETRTAIENLKSKYPHLIYKALEQHQGKSAALREGFDRAQGEIIITLDGDLQDDPNDIPTLLEYFNSSSLDLLCGWKRKRQDSCARIFVSKLFNTAANLLTGIRLHDINCGFKLIRKNVLSAFPSEKGFHRFLPIFAKWNGYRVEEHIITNHKRRYGKSKFGMGRGLKGLCDLIKITIHKRRYIK